jgi:hypothetical protein
VDNDHEIALLKAEVEAGKIHTQQKIRALGEQLETARSRCREQTDTASLLKAYEENQKRSSAMMAIMKVSTETFAKEWTLNQQELCAHLRYDSSRLDQRNPELVATLNNVVGTTLMAKLGLKETHRPDEVKGQGEASEESEALRRVSHPWWETTRERWRKPGTSWASGIQRRPSSASSWKV